MAIRATSPFECWVVGFDRGVLYTPNQQEAEQTAENAKARGVEYKLVHLVDDAFAEAWEDAEQRVKLAVQQHNEALSAWESERKVLQLKLEREVARAEKAEEAALELLDFIDENDEENEHYYDPRTLVERLPDELRERVESFREVDP